MDFIVLGLILVGKGMREEVDILEKGTKCKLLSTINKVLLHLAPTLLFAFMSRTLFQWC